MVPDSASKVISGNVIAIYLLKLQKDWGVSLLGDVVHERLFWPFHLPHFGSQTRDNVWRLRMLPIESKFSGQTNLGTWRLKNRVSVPAPSDTICRVCWVVDLRAASIRRSIERVRTYVPSVSPTNAKRTPIDDWRLSFDRFHKLFNERVVKVSKGRSRTFCEFCVDVCLLNDGQLILLVVMGSFASLHCRCRSDRSTATKLAWALGSEVQSPLIIPQTWTR
jgi:hypothetical protein